MPFEYRPHGLYAAPLDPLRCKASVPDGGRSVGHHQCLRKPWKDGWCKQHHPESEARRQEESNRRYEAKRKRSLPYRYDEAMEQLTVLRAEDERLRENVEIRDSQITDAMLTIQEIRVEVRQLRELVHTLLGGLVFTHPYARRRVSDDWECAYCEHGWENGSPERHAEDCPVVLGRAILEEGKT